MTETGGADAVYKFLARHRADQAVVEASRCYAEDTCTMDPGCPFVVHCLQACRLEKETP